MPCTSLARRRRARRIPVEKRGRAVRPGRGHPASRARAWTHKLPPLPRGQAYGLARLLLGLPHALARGRVPLPQSRLDACAVSNQELLSGEGGSNVAALIASLCAEARKALATSREQVANLPRQVRPAFLPLALVEPYLRALERPGRDVLRSVAEIAPLTRVWRIAAAHWLGRI